MALQVSLHTRHLKKHWTGLECHTENLRLQASRIRQADCKVPKPGGAILPVPRMRIIVFRDPYIGAHDMETTSQWISLGRHMEFIRI